MKILHKKNLHLLMQQYLDLLKTVMKQGVMKDNRTGVRNIYNTLTLFILEIILRKYMQLQIFLIKF